MTTVDDEVRRREISFKQDDLRNIVLEEANRMSFLADNRLSTEVGGGRLTWFTACTTMGRDPFTARAYTLRALSWLVFPSSSSCLSLSIPEEIDGVSVPIFCISMIQGARNGGMYV